MASLLAFKVDRKEPELIAPSKPAPYELKPLSDLDDQKGLWTHSYSLHFYRKDVVRVEGRDPVTVIKQAVADTLVYYYPLAGRLREGANGKLFVECTGEGVLFTEADAHVRLDQFPEPLLPPFPGTNDLLYDVPGSVGILHCPLVLIQVTRLMCGGFTFAIRVNHTMCDGVGYVQFLIALSEMACGARTLSINPIWKRELLKARDPPKVTNVHHVYHELPRAKHTPLDDMVQCSFFFRLQDISIRKSQLPPLLHRCSNFDILVALFWRCRTRALDINPDDVVRLSLAINARKKLNPPVPIGYYGNTFVQPVVLTTAGELCRNSLEWGVELVRKAKEEVTEEFVRSTIDFLVKNGRPSLSTRQMYTVSDLTSLAFNKVEFGFGKAAYSGNLPMGHIVTFFVSSSNSKGEDGTAVIIKLPRHVMKRLAFEIKNIMNVSSNMNLSSIVSSL